LSLDSYINPTKDKVTLSFVGLICGPKAMALGRGGRPWKSA